MRLLFTALAFLISVSLFGQCEITKGALPNGTLFYSTSTEILFMNLDLESVSGIQTLFAEMKLYQNPKDIDDIETHLVIESMFNEYNSLHPRSLKISFDDNTSIDLRAKWSNQDLGDSTNGNVTLIDCTFIINPEMRLIIALKGISNIKIYDHRTGQSVNAKPYKYLLQEQVMCLIDSYVAGK
jgi:hypothetical protein